MILSNYHSHCTFCDGRSYPENYVVFALANRFRAYGFSSHAPLPFETNWNMSSTDMPEYLAEINRLKKKYADRIEIYTALEIDYLDWSYNASIPYFKNLPLDYRIGAIHFLPIADPLCEKNMAAIDGPFEDYDFAVKHYFHNEIQLYVRRYFDSLSHMIDDGGFDIVGHIDKIYMHGQHFADFSVSAPWYVKLLSDCLEKVAQKGLMLEINTKNWTKKQELFPHQSFLPLINELKIPVMVNSDSHYPDLINDGRPEAFELLKKAGFRSTRELIHGQWIDWDF